jgi:hypothetical protein
MAASWDDELITADCDLDMCTLGRTTILAFEKTGDQRRMDELLDRSARCHQRCGKTWVTLGIG